MVYFNELVGLGLSEEEIAVYIASLELGGGFVSQIAKRAQVHRVSCYHTLENLVAKGLVLQVMKNNMKFFMPEPPQKLVNIYQEKLNIAKTVLPELLSISNQMAFKPKILYYEGRDGIQTIFEKMSHASGEILAFTNLETLPDLLPDFLPTFCTSLVEKNIKTRYLAPSSDVGFQFVDRYYKSEAAKKMIEVLYVNPREFPFENKVAIFDNKVAIISLNPEELLGVLIESNVYARTQRAIFNLAWLGATSFVAR